MIINGKEYTIGVLDNDMVEVIQWNDGEHVNAVTIEWQEGDTVGDAIKRAYPQETGDGN